MSLRSQYILNNRFAKSPECFSDKRLDASSVYRCAELQFQSRQSVLSRQDGRPENKISARCESVSNTICCLTYKRNVAREPVPCDHVFPAFDMLLLTSTELPESCIIALDYFHYADPFTRIEYHIHSFRFCSQRKLNTKVSELLYRVRIILDKLHDHSAGICSTQDLDIVLKHMNNARYLRELDFARFYFWDAIGLYEEITKRGAGVVQGATSTRYRRAIPLLTPYKITTKVLPRAFIFDSLPVLFVHSSRQL